MNTEREQTLALGPLWIRSWRKPEGVELVMCDEAKLESISLDLRVVPPCRAAVGSMDRQLWYMARVVPRPYSGDVLGTMLCWSAGRLGKRPTRMARLREYLRALVVHAVDLCAPELRRTALRFSSTVRFDVYGLMAADRSGRVTQLATTCPGALIFAAGIISHTGSARRWIAEKLLRDVREGRKLDHALSDAVAAHLDADKGRQLSLFPPATAPRAPDLRGSIDRLRYLIRRAGPLVPRACLLGVPVTILVPEDIPRSPCANGAWYSVMRACGDLQKRGTGNPELEHLVRFASRHARFLVRTARERAMDLSAVLRVLWDFVRTEGRRPSRRTDPAALLAGCAKWHEAASAQLSVAQLCRSLVLPEPVEGDIPLPAPPRPDVGGGDLVVRALRSASQLIEEGTVMQHCIATYLPQVLDGASAIYSATVAGRRLTLELARDDDGRWQLGELTGRANHPATREERNVLLRWLDGAAEAADGAAAP